MSANFESNRDEFVQILKTGAYEMKESVEAAVDTSTGNLSIIVEEELEEDPMQNGDSWSDHLILAGKSVGPPTRAGATQQTESEDISGCTQASAGDTFMNKYKGTVDNVMTPAARKSSPRHLKIRFSSRPRTQLITNACRKLDSTSSSELASSRCGCRERAWGCPDS